MNLSRLLFSAAFWFTMNLAVAGQPSPFPRVANTTSIYFDHVEAEALLIALDLKGISVSGGSACQSGASEPSHVLTAMGLSPARARATLRFSLSKLTTEAEIDEVLTIVPAAVMRLRELSPAYKAAVATT